MQQNFTCFEATKTTLSVSKHLSFLWPNSRLQVDWNVHQRIAVTHETLSIRTTSPQSSRIERLEIVEFWECQWRIFELLGKSNANESNKDWCKWIFPVDISSKNPTWESNISSHQVSYFDPTSNFRLNCCQVTKGFRCWTPTSKLLQLSKDHFLLEVFGVLDIS